jgi:hypothetical protein
VVLWLGLTTPARADQIADAERAMTELRYDDARALVTGLVAAGHHSRAELLAIDREAAEVASVFDGPEAGEREYRRLLVLDPKAMPPRQTPVFAVPFARARRWQAQAGALRATHEPPSGLSETGATELAVRVQSDPLAMVWGLRLHRRPAGGWWSDRDVVEVAGTQVTLPPESGAVDYYLELLDERQDVLDSLGSPAAPFRLAPATARAAPRARLWRPAVAMGASAVVLFGVGLGLDLAASHEFSRLQGTCAPECSTGQRATFDAERGLAVAGYSLAAAAAVTGLVLLTIDRVRARR